MSEKYRVDSLYKGYPTGYPIISKSPDLKLKNGSLSVDKKIMIDGQQRVTAMMTTLIGGEVCIKKQITITYNPFANGFAQPNLAAKDLAKYSISVPTIHEQQEIICILDTVLEKESRAKEAAQTVLDQIALLKKSILARAFRGEV